jgi:adenylate cyclase
MTSDNSSSQNRLERRRVAILAADVDGYTRQMEADEEGTHTRLMKVRHEVIEPSIEEWRGTIVKHTGDGFLAMFEGVTDAASCAVGLQQSLGALAAADSAENRLSFRMGITVSEAIMDSGDVFGEGVNIAARLQSYAEPGGIVVPAEVAEQLDRRLDVRRIDLGDLYLKNIRQPVRAVSLLLSSDREATSPFVARKPDSRPSIAVLPFRKNLVNEEEGYFADGIVDDIIRVLSGFKELVVIARGSTLGLGGPMMDPRMVGRALGVRYVLHGGIARVGGRVRITTELSDATSGAILRADRYDRDAADLFELQDRISMQVMATIAPQIREQELQRAKRKHPESMDAYDLVLQAIDLLYRMEYVPFSGARGLLQQARVFDADYAPAYAYAAQWHTFRIGQGWSANRREDAHEAARLAAAAVERDKYDAAALAISGHANSFLLHDYDTGIDLTDRALAAGPSSALAWNLASCTSSYIGEGREAVARAEHSLRLSPRDPLSFFYLCNLGIAHYADGNYEQAVQFGRKAAAQKKTFRANLRTLAASLVAIEQVSEARTIAATLAEVDPSFRLSTYRQLVPWRQADSRNLFIDRLRQAGLPE